VFAGHRIDALAGRGGMGVVFRATDLRLNRTVALKLISPELSNDEGFRRRFQRESQTAASIRHPNVITIFHAGEEAGILFVTMDFIEGTDLSRLLRTTVRCRPRPRRRCSPRSGPRSTPRTRVGLSTAT
jgi:serine/threonine protein kinase